MIEMIFAEVRGVVVVVVVDGHPRFGDRPKSSIAILAIVVIIYGRTSIGAVVDCYVLCVMYL